MMAWVEMAEFVQHRDVPKTPGHTHRGLKRDHGGWGSPNSAQSWLLPDPSQEPPARQSSISMSPEDHGGHRGR